MGKARAWNPGFHTEASMIQHPTGCYESIMRILYCQHERYKILAGQHYLERNISYRHLRTNMRLPLLSLAQQTTEQQCTTSVEPMRDSFWPPFNEFRNGFS